MEKEKYEDAVYRLKRVIQAIFDDGLVCIGIDDYDDAQRTECIVETFSVVTVVVCGTITRAQLAEMAWYGCNLDYIGATHYYSKDEAACRLYFDCRAFVNDLNAQRP